MKRVVGRHAVAISGRAIAVLAAMLSASGLVHADQYVAGVDPSQRPQGAPMIQAPQKGADWKTAALRGVSDPKPASLKFLDDQGSWYTPFNHAGMPGYYDIRGLHAKR